MRENTGASIDAGRDGQQRFTMEWSEYTEALTVQRSTRTTLEKREIDQITSYFFADQRAAGDEDRREGGRKALSEHSQPLSRRTRSRPYTRQLASYRNVRFDRNQC